MGTTPSPIQQFPLMDNQTTIAGTRDAVNNMVEEIEKKVVMVFDTSTQMTSRIPVPTEGMLAWVKDANILYVHNGSSWAQVYPPAPRIYSGTGLPTNAIGQNGDIYFRG